LFDIACHALKGVARALKDVARALKDLARALKDVARVLTFRSGNGKKTATSPKALAIFQEAINLSKKRKFSLTSVSL
jgi:uncharacterized protein YoxC